jgi:hypothetical protein
MALRTGLVALAAFTAAASAQAQEPTFTLSAYSPPAAAGVLATGTGSDTAGLSPSAASLPIRLSLISAIYPMGPAFGVGGCSGSSVAVAGTIFPTQPYTQIQLTPRLVLHGFSDLGCPGDPYAPIDAGAGGGLTYAMPLQPSLWLVPSAGFYAVPGISGAPVRTVAGGGLDLAVQSKSGRVFTTGVGVSTISGRGVRVVPRIGGTF